MLAREQFKDILAILFHVSNKETSSTHTLNPNLANIIVSMCTFVTFFNAHFHDPLWVVQWRRKFVRYC
jgi:hypothetical protein